MFKRKRIGELCFSSLQEKKRKICTAKNVKLACLNCRAAQRKCEREDKTKPCKNCQNENKDCLKHFYQAQPKNEYMESLASDLMDLIQNEQPECIKCKKATTKTDSKLCWECFLLVDTPNHEF